MRANINSWLVAVLAGLLPIIAANAAFLINTGAGMESCMPYWEGCMSVSRGVRTGPGLILFKVLALPTALAMILCWRQAGRWLTRTCDTGPARKKALVWMGVTGAVFYLVYAAWLGTEGEIYRWMRRYGVVFYFGLTGLAQLFLVSVLWKQRRSILRGRLRREITGFCATVESWIGSGLLSREQGMRLLDFPDLNIIAYHAGWPTTEELIGLCGKHSNRRSYGAH